MAVLEEVQHGNFAAMFVGGERGTPFLSVTGSVRIPLVWAGFLVSTIQEAKVHCSGSAAHDTLCLTPTAPFLSCLRGQKGV